MESDWKKFRAMIPKLRERYLTSRNLRIAAILTAADKNHTERFWDAMEEMETEAKVLRYCLDGHTRSRMFLFILSMVRHGMMASEDLAEFSPELQPRISTSPEWDATKVPLKS